MMGILRLCATVTLPTAQVPAMSTRAAQAREQGLQHAEPVQALTPALALPPFRAWTNLLRNELAAGVGGHVLGTNVGGAPCAPAPSRYVRGCSCRLPTGPKPWYRAAQSSLSCITGP